jgi:diguanylate cyclase (GGDEF)-like protein
VRSYDAVGRYGGEEFLIVFPGCSARMAKERAEQIRLIMSEPSPSPSEKPITVSMGVASATSPEQGEDMLSCADAALYRAKRYGRNRVELAPEKCAIGEATQLPLLAEPS